MKGRWRELVGVVVSVALVWLLFRGTDWSEVAGALRGLDWRWLLLAQIPIWGSYFTRTQRWAYVVRAVQPASFRSLFAATQIGNLVNLAVPARLGELVRAYVLRRLEAVPLSRAIATCAVDRLNDVVGLLAILLVTGAALATELQVEFPTGSFGNTEPLVVSSQIILPAALGLLGLSVAAVGVLVLLYVRRDPIVRMAGKALGWLSEGLASRGTRLLAGFAEGMHVFRSRRDLGYSVFWSLVTWMAHVASLAAIVAAFGVEFPWYTPFLMAGLIASFIAVPAAPGMVGQYHLPAVAGLLMAAPDTSPATAKAAAILAHLFVVVPIAILGFYSLVAERLGVLDLVRESTRREPGASASNAAHANDI